MTLWDYLPQPHRVPPYWIASMHASMSENNTRNMQITPFGRFTHLPRVSASFWSLKCQERVMVVAMLPFSVIDALCNRSLWCASDHLYTFEAISFSYIV